MRCLKEISAALGEGDVNYSYYTRSAYRVVLIELKRAGRREEMQKMEEELLATADTPAEIVMALSFASETEDRKHVLMLFDRFVKADSQSNDKSPQATQWSAQIGSMLASIVGKSGSSPMECLELVDRYLSYHAVKNQAQRTARQGRSTSRTPVSPRNYVTVYSGSSGRSITMTYPTANAYFDSSALSLLRTAFEVFKQKDLASDLVKHLQTRSAEAAGIEKLYRTLALAYVQVWHEDQEAAVKALAAATEQAPQDFELRLDVARFYQQTRQFDEALATVDAVTPLDQASLQDRESLALSLAVTLGDQERARQAAKRLFGLRLDAETQVQLVGQMRRLGMHEEAEAVLARAQGQAGSRLGAMAALMTQHQADGKIEIAAQMAHQILRRSRTASASQVAQGYSTADDSYRRNALQCLAQSGKLKELIAGTEKQIERSPQSTQLHETLSEYWQAAGDQDKSLEVQGKIVALRPDDADLRFRYAQLLSNRGKTAEACEEYMTVIKKQPRLLGNRYYEVIRTFQQAKREVELARLLEEIDVRALGQPYVASELVSNLLRSSTASSANRAAGMALFKKVWDAQPSYRASLMQYFYDAELWKLPEVYEYGKKSLLPTPPLAKQQPWYGVSSSLSYSSDGTVTGVLKHVLDTATRNNDLPKLREEILQAHADCPEWLAGKAIVALIDLRMGREANLREELKPLLETKLNDYTMRHVRWIIGQEIDSKPQWRELAIELYTPTLEPSNDSMDEFEYSPARRLVKVYQDAGQREEARRVLLTAASAKETERFSSDPAYNAYRRSQRLASLGRQFVQLEFPIEAMKVYRELLSDLSLAEVATSPNYGSMVERNRTQARQELQSITEKVAADTSGDALAAILTPAANAPPELPAVDLMLFASSSGGKMATIESTLARVLRGALKPAAAETARTQLAELAQQRPRDFSVLIAQTLLVLTEKDEAQSGQALKRLEQLVDEVPLEELPTGQRPNSRQRTEAAQQIGLWLAARECFRKPELRRWERSSPPAPSRPPQDKLNKSCSWRCTTSAARWR